MTSTGYPSLETLVTAARRRVEVTKEELAEGRRRRQAIAYALRREFPGSRVYFNGSLAHGDALTPLTDIDLGIVIDEALDSHGPGKQGPRDLMERAADAIRRELKDDFPELTVQVQGCTRAVLVRFGDPVHAGEKDFTCDVICAVDNQGDAGLFIPKVPGWSRSDPEAHTGMVLEAIKDTEIAFAHVVRLLKHWNRRNGKPLCSWNIKALALGCLIGPISQIDGVERWFAHAASELAQGETEDPAGVAEKPIKLGHGWTRFQVVEAIEVAARRLKDARRLERDGYPLQAHEELAKLFNDDEMMPHPAQEAVRLEAVRRYKELSIGGSAVGVGRGADRPQVPVSSWAP